MLKEVCNDLELEAGYVFHSLRHGGATHDYLAGVPLEEILHHGRWASVASARHYIQAGRALLMATALPAFVLKWGREVDQNLVKYFRSAQASSAV